MGPMSTSVCAAKVSRDKTVLRSWMLVLQTHVNMDGVTTEWRDSGACKLFFEEFQRFLLICTCEVPGLKQNRCNPCMFVPVVSYGVRQGHPCMS